MNGFQYAGKVKVCNESIVFLLLSYTSYYPGGRGSALSKTNIGPRLIKGNNNSR
jgi:hypothetical protein